MDRARSILINYDFSLLHYIKKTLSKQITWVRLTLKDSKKRRKAATNAPDNEIY
jgi:hypothetical protein